MNPRELPDYRVNTANKNYEFWQRDSLAIELYSPDIIYQKLDYIHLNPLSERWNLVNDPIQYHYSSASLYESNSSPFSFLSHIGSVI